MFRAAFSLAVPGKHDDLFDGLFGDGMPSEAALLAGIAAHPQRVADGSLLIYGTGKRWGEPLLQVLVDEMDTEGLAAVDSLNRTALVIHMLSAWERMDSEDCGLADSLIRRMSPDALMCTPTTAMDALALVMGEGRTERLKLFLRQIGPNALTAEYFSHLSGVVVLKPPVNYKILLEYVDEAALSLTTGPVSCALVALLQRLPSPPEEILELVLRKTPSQALVANSFADSAISLAERNSPLSFFQRVCLKAGEGVSEMILAKMMILALNLGKVATAQWLVEQYGERALHSPIEPRCFLPLLFEAISTLNRRRERALDVILWLLQWPGILEEESPPASYAVAFPLLRVFARPLEEQQTIVDTIKDQGGCNWKKLLCTPQRRDDSLGLDVNNAEFALRRVAEESSVGPYVDLMHQNEDLTWTMTDDGIVPLILYAARAERWENVSLLVTVTPRHILSQAVGGESALSVAQAKGAPANVLSMLQPLVKKAS